MTDHHVILADLSTEIQYGREMPVTVARFREKERRASQRERDLAIKRARRGEAPVMRHLIVGALAALVAATLSMPADAAMYWMPGYHAELCQDYTTVRGAGVACAGDVLLLTGRRLDYDDVLLGRVSADTPPQMVAFDDVSGDGDDKAERSLTLPRGAVAFGPPYYVTIGHAPTVARTLDARLEITF